jgi:hypothetical protein
VQCITEKNHPVKDTPGKNVTPQSV